MAAQVWKHQIKSSEDSDSAQYFANEPTKALGFKVVVDERENVSDAMYVAPSMKSVALCFYEVYVKLTLLISLFIYKLSFI